MVDFKEHRLNDVVVLELKGVAEFGDSRAIKEKLNEIGQTCHNLVLDFFDIEYIGSSVLGVLATEYKKYRQEGGDIKIARLNESLKRLFRITRFNELFTVFSDVDSAVASFSSEG